MIDTATAPANDVPNHIEPIDGTNLWRMDTFTDMQHGDLQVLTPVSDSNVRDMKRASRFFSTCNVMFRGRVVPCRFEVEGPTLAGALKNFSGAASRAGEKMIADMESQVARQSILAPGVMPHPRLN